MIKLDENLLVELGLGALPKDEKTTFLKHMYETLEMRVGTRLAEKMSDQQMSEFEQFISSNDEQGAFHWLESNFPNYKEVVAEEFEKLKGEIKPVAADILAASQAQAQATVHTPHAADGAQPQPQSQPPQEYIPAADPAQGGAHNPPPAYHPEPHSTNPNSQAQDQPSAPSYQPPPASFPPSPAQSNPYPPTPTPSTDTGSPAWPAPQTYTTEPTQPQRFTQPQPPTSQPPSPSQPPVPPYPDQSS